MTLTEDAPVAPPAPSPAGELPGIVRRRLAVLVVVGLVLGVLGLVVLATRPAHKPSAASVRNVPVSISCSAAGTCAAVDDQGNAVRLVDGTWRRPTPLGVPAMTAVSCAGPGFCAATSITGSVSVLRDGHWSARTKIDPRASGLLDLFGMSGVSAVSCPTDAFCMAGDVLGRFYLYDGTRWSPGGKIEPASVYATDAGRNDEAVVGLSCPSATFCAAVTAGGRAMTWNGSAWSAPVVLTPEDSIALQELLYLPAVTGVSCASPTFCMAVASNGDAYRYDGSAWSAPLPIDLASAHEGTHDGLTAVSCPSTTSCTATDDLGRVLTYDGTSWSGARRIDASLGLNAVSCTGPTFCVALDDLGEALVDRAGTWSGPAFVDP